MSKSSQDLKNIVPILGLFAAASFRLIPSFSRILHGFQSLRFNLPSALTVNKELTQTIKDTNAENIWITHGREDGLVRWCNINGLNAKPLSIIGSDEEVEQ